MSRFDTLYDSLIAEANSKMDKAVAMASALCDVTSEIEQALDEGPSPFAVTKIIETKGSRKKKLQALRKDIEAANAKLMAIDKNLGKINLPKEIVNKYPGKKSWTAANLSQAAMSMTDMFRSLDSALEADDGSDEQTTRLQELRQVMGYYMARLKNSMESGREETEEAAKIWRKMVKPA